MNKPNRMTIRIAEEETPFDGVLPSTFLDLPEGDELVPSSNIEVRGMAYEADEWAVVEGTLEATLSLPCATCNERTEIRVCVDPWKYSVPLREVKNGLLDVTEAIREAILLEVPFIVKCGGKECRNRKSVERYLTPQDRIANEDGEERNQPFRSLL